MKLEDMTLAEVSAAFAAKELSPVEYAKNAIRVCGENKDLNAVVTLDEELALRQAAQSETRYLHGAALSPLDGVPIGIKDIIDTADLTTTYGCQAYAGHRPARDAFPVARLKQAGANVFLKTNTSQFALGPTGEVSYGGPVRNPRNRAYTTGGSSSGSGSAVAGRLVPGALGSDSGGSIRVPASICGVVGIKPTFGLVSNEGVMPVSETVDCVGPMTRTVEDGAMILQAIAGYNIEDWRSVPASPANYTARLSEPVRGAKAAVVTSLLKGAVMPEVVQGCLAAAETLRAQGVEVREVELPNVEPYRLAHQQHMLAMAHACHREDMALHRKDIYDEVAARLESGFLDSDQYVSYERMKNQFRRILLDTLGDADCLIYPTTPLVACKIGEGHATRLCNGIETSSYASNGRLTWAASFACMPCVSVPAAFTAEGLPVGVSLMGRPFDEQNLLRLANALFLATGLVL